MKRFLAIVLILVLVMGMIAQTPNVEAGNNHGNKGNTTNNGNNQLVFSPKLSILEIVDKVSSKLSTPLQYEDFEITTITMKEFVASREEIDGKYDIIAIPAGDYSPAAVSGKNHATQNVLNDITNLKANEIINQFINKGQPVILERKAIKNSGKLQQHFDKEFNGSDKNVIFYNGNGTDKQQDLLSHLRNFFKEAKDGHKYYIPRPRFELTEPTNKVYQPGDTLAFTLEMIRPTDITAKDLKAFLYIDSNFNDQYDASEIVLEQSITSTTSTLSYKLPRGYSGVRNWKLEVVDMGTNLKDYQKGTIQFKDQKVQVNVLQIQKNRGDSGNLNNMTLADLSTEDYQINIDVTNMNDFNKSTGMYSHSKINGKYDMLIFGFADSYNNAAINDNAVQSVDKFIKTNQSILFTHDTIFETNNNWVNNFMDDTGQKAPLTNLGYGAPNPSTTTKKVNEGLITTYPYELDDNITIATTHNQYYTLDLEDPKVIPWYNITGSDRDEYDSWNHYYTYSKGNITYSGTGHTNTNFPEEEQKLFVNTMYRAFQGSNHAPVLTVLNPKDKDVIPAHQKIELSYTLQDFDLKDTQLSTKVFLNDNSEPIYTNNEVTNGSTIVQSIDHGMSEGGDVVLRIEATDSQGAKTEKIIHLKIAKIEANLEISRTTSTPAIVPVDSEIQLNYKINPKKITGDAAKSIKENEKIISNVIYKETFPANVEVTVPTGFTRKGDIKTGYTVTGILPEVKYTRVGDEFIAEPSHFVITVTPKGKDTFSLNQAQISYIDINNQTEMVQFNPITIQADYIIESVTLPENTVINKGIGKNLALDLMINPKDAGIKEIVWSVTKGQDIFSVDPITGVVTTNKEEGSGEVTVTVTDVFGNKETANTYVSVRVPIENMEVQDLTLQVNEEKSLPIKITPENAKKGVTIELADPSLARIDKDHWKITGLNPGETIMTVKGINSKGDVIERSAKLTIESVLVKEISVTPNVVNLQKLGILREHDFTITIQPANATNKELDWESLNSEFVGVIRNDETGTVQLEGRKTGTAQIQISSADEGDASTTITVHVGSPLQGISASTILMKKGDKINNAINYIIKIPEDATTIVNRATFTSSSNSDIVSVSADGTLEAKRLGKATVEITVVDENGEIYTAQSIVKVTVDGIDPGENGSGQGGEGSDKY